MAASTRALIINLKHTIMAYNTISKKYILDYITKNYGEMKQDLARFTLAINQTAKEFNLNKKDLFHYMIERASTIPMSQSYGFDTAYGRDIRETLESNYYNA
jgi:hypothetical protein